MSINVILNVPPEIEERLRRESANLEADLAEACALELFRRGSLSHYELSQVIGFDRCQTDAWLKRREVFEGSPTAEDLEADYRTLERLLPKAR